MSRRVTAAVIIVVVSLTLVSVGVFYLYSLRALPRLAFAPAWTLSDSAGQKRTSEELKGSIILYTFSGTDPRDPRRETADLMSEVHRAMDAAKTDVPVRFVTILLDGSEAAAKAFEGRFGGATAAWQTLFGGIDVLTRIVRDGFGVYIDLAKSPPEYDPVYVLVDGMGIVRAIYRYSRPSVDLVREDIESVTREAMAGGGALRLAYEAAHLFSCYRRI